MTEKPLRALLVPMALAIAIAAPGCTGSQSSNVAASAAPASATPPSATPAVTATPAAEVPLPAPTVVAARRAPTSPCDLPGGWWFKGSCVLELFTPHGGVMTLAPYRGIAVTMAFGDNDAPPQPIPFVAADAIGDGDIAGRINGAFPFAGYGRQCVTASRSLAPCVGKPLIYLTIANGGHVRVRFNATPVVSVTSARGFPGKVCAMATMVGIDTRGQTAWVVPPSFAVPNGTKLRFESQATPQTYPNGGAVTIFAIVCR